MSLVQAPTGERPAAGAGRGSGSAAGRRRGSVGERVLGSPFAVSVVACAVAAAVSAAVLPTVPSYDPWSWIVWGREVVDPHLSFAVGGGPSWKPLPVLFTTVFGVFGGAAPTLWVITARAGGLMGLVAAYRLAARLASGRGSSGAGPESRAAGWPVLAGVLAAAAVMLTQDWAYYMFRGTSEPMLIGASLWAIDRHLSGRFGAAFWLGVAASLIRPEVWPLLLGYAVWLWLRSPGPRSAGLRSPRVWLVVGLLAIPFLWFVPPWIGSGDPFLAASHAKAYNGHLGSHPFLTVLRRGADLQTAPVLLLGVVAAVLGWFRRRDRVVLTLAGFALVWWVIVVAMTLDGYPGLERFFLPAAAVACVLAGAGVAWLASLASGRSSALPGSRRSSALPASRRSSTLPASRRSSAVPASRRSGRLRVAVAGLVGALVAGALVAACVPFLSTRVSVARAQEAVAARAVTRLSQLSDAVALVGGHRGVYPCRRSFAAVNHGVQTALAWKLHVTLGRVGTVMRHQGLLFVGPHDTIDGGPAPISRRLTQERLLAVAGAWRVYRVTAPGAATRCVGR
jgi:hypothetical protein